jgi:hypothetical protein
MRKHTRFDSLNSLETLDHRLTPAPLSLGASLVPPAVGNLVSTADDDSQPDTEPSSALDTPAPATELPPTGPVGPGTS